MMSHLELYYFLNTWNHITVCKQMIIVIKFEYLLEII